MGKFGSCQKHSEEYEIDWKRCDTCSGDGFVINDDYGFEQERTCWHCQGDGEHEIPKCQQCEDEYEEEL